MRTCQSCSAPLDESATRCPKCGLALTPVAEPERRADDSRTMMLPADYQFNPEQTQALPPPNSERAREVADMRARMDAIVNRAARPEQEQRGYTVQWLGEQVLGASGAGQNESPFDSASHLPPLGSGFYGALGEQLPPPADASIEPPDVAQVDRKQPTVGEQFAATVDLGSLPAPPDSPENSEPDLKNPTLPDRRLAATYQHDEGREEPGTLNNRRIDATLDSTPLDDSDAERLAGLWRGTISPQTTPRMTIKGQQDRVSANDSRLVIINRAVRDVSEAAIGARGAEYELLGKIGEGGMGVVYAARQASIDRTVALKMLKPDMASDADQRNKFLSEAVVTGDLDHPNIVPIYDLGANEQRALFYSMKRVQGTPWVDALLKKTQTENLEILMKVADAVGFAHSRGVVHRDLKPENIMLGEFGEVLVMDWGLALSTAIFRKAGSITQSTSMGGTPAYMAPEMATGPIECVGPASDIYLLGAMLFEIIAGFPPHTGKNVMNCLYAAARNEIRATPHSGELMEIARKAMSTAQSARYASVKDFQDAIRQFRSHAESIALATRAQSDLETAEKSGEYQVFSRGVFAFEEAIALWDGNIKAKSGLSAAKLAYAQSAFGKGDFDLANSLLDVKNPKHAPLHRQVAAAQKERDARQQRLRTVRNMAGALAASIVLIICGAMFWINSERSKAINAANLASAAEVQATKERDKAVEAQEKATSAEQRAKTDRDVAQDAKAQAVKDATAARKAEGEAQDAKVAQEYEAYIARIGLASAKIEENAFDPARELLDQCKPEKLRNWEWGRLEHLCRRDDGTINTPTRVTTVASSSDGQQLASGGEDGIVRIWDTKTLKPIREFRYGAAAVNALVYSPNDRQLAVGGADQAGYLRLFNTADGSPAKAMQDADGHKDAITSVVFSKDGRQLLTASMDNSAKLWDVQGGRLIRSFIGHTWWVWSARFSPDERQIVTASQDGTAVIWPVAEQSASGNKTLPTFTGHRGAVYSASFSPDPRNPLVASAGYDKRVLVWDPRTVEPFDFSNLSAPRTPPKFVALEGHTSPIRSVRFSADGRRLVSGAYDNTVRLWDVDEHQLIRVFRGHGEWVEAVDFLTDGLHIASASLDKTVKLWNIQGYEESRVLQGHLLTGHDDAVLSAAFSYDGKTIVTASRDRTAKLWDFATGKELETFKEGHEYLASAAIFFPGGKKLVTAAVDDTARVWDVTAGSQIYRLNETGRAAAVALSPDGKWILTGGDQQTSPPEAAGSRNSSDDNRPRRSWLCRLWDAEKGEPVLTLADNAAEITAVAFSPDGKRFYTGDNNGHGLLRKLPDGAIVARLEGHAGRIAAAAFLPGGNRLLTASSDNTVAQWDAASGQEIKPLVLKHPDAISSMAISADGQRALTSCADKIVRLWDLQQATQLGTLDTAGEIVNTVAISPSGLQGVTVGYTKSDSRTGVARSVVRTWNLSSLKPINEINTRGGLVWSAVFTEDNSSVLTVGGNNARLWDLRTNREKMSFSPHSAVASAVLSPDGKRLLTGSWDNSAKIWNVETGLSELKLNGGHKAHINTAQFSPDGSHALTASDDGTAKLWDATTGKVVGEYVGHKARVLSAEFSPDGKQVLTTCSDHTASLWDTASGKQRYTLVGHTSPVSCGDMAADGRVVTGSDDNTARIWTAEGKPLMLGESPLVLAGHTAGVTSVAFSPDGKRILTGSRDNSVKLWDSATGKEILTLKGHQQEVTSVAFSHDGRFAVSASQDGTAIVWLTTDWSAGAQAVATTK